MPGLLSVLDPLTMYEMPLKDSLLKVFCFKGGCGYEKV